MRAPVTTFWGKLEKEDGQPPKQWHPLLAHCADVAACAEALLQHTLLRRRLATLAGRDDLDEVDVARLSALAALHDIGKFNLGFQRKQDVEPRNTAGHVSEPLALFSTRYPETKKLFAQLPVADLQRWCGGGESAFQLLTASIGHHGRPVRWGEIPPEPALWQKDGALDLGDRMPDARTGASKAVRAIGLDVGLARATLGAEVPGFESISAGVHP